MERKTDWDRYYSKPYRTASYSRTITTRIITGSIRRHLDAEGDISIIELGGGNSVFLQPVYNSFNPAEYVVIDNNRVGLDMLNERIRPLKNAKTLCNDMFSLQYKKKADLVFSVGLIEHFDAVGTRDAINVHFDLLKTGGIAVITFPTPTALYKITRSFSELLGLWIFHDERPRELDEVVKACRNRGRLLEKRIIWPIFLTQGLVVFKKTSEHFHCQKKTD